MAADVSDLFTAKVPVTSQSAQQLSSAQRQAMQQVLVRVSGLSSVLDNPVIKTQLPEAGSYVLQYGYLNTTPKQLQVQFDQRRVTRLLRQAEEPVWGSRRPLVLVWMVTEQDFKREITADASERATALKELAAVRGLPLVLPLMDLDDSFAITASDIWGGFLDPLVTASARYGADAIVVVRLYPEGEQNTADWRFYDITEGQQMLVRGGSASGGDEVLNQQVIGSTADWLAAKYAVRASALDSDSLEIVVENVTDISVYLELEKLLDSFVSVSKVHLVRQQGEESVFSLRLVGSPEDLLNELELDRHLRAVGEVIPELDEMQPDDPLQAPENEQPLPGEVAQGQELPDPNMQQPEQGVDPIEAFYGDSEAEPQTPQPAHALHRYRWVP